jgi:hypothetical protein
VWDLWWTHDWWDGVFSANFRFPPVSVIPSTLHTYLLRNTTLIIRTSGRGHGTYETTLCQISGKTEYRGTSTLTSRPCHVSGCLSPSCLRFSVRPVRVRFVVNKVAMELDFPRSVSWHMCCIHVLPLPEGQADETSHKTVMF